MEAVGSPETSILPKYTVLHLSRTSAALYGEAVPRNDTRFIPRCPTLKMEQRVPPKRRHLSTKLHGVIVRKGGKREERKYIIINVMLRPVKPSLLKRSGAVSLGFSHWQADEQTQRVSVAVTLLSQEAHHGVPQCLQTNIGIVPRLCLARLLLNPF
jgi:hypothetical protein